LLAAGTSPSVCKRTSKPELRRDVLAPLRAVGIDRVAFLKAEPPMTRREARNRGRLPLEVTFYVQVANFALDAPSGGAAITPDGRKISTLG
jgi:hypothetical protein